MRSCLNREFDGVFVFTVPVLPGCVSQGDSRKEALLIFSKRSNSISRIAVFPGIPCQKKSGLTVAGADFSSTLAVEGL
jgi:hypothetical protein